MNIDIESIASYADFEGFIEETPTLSRPWNDNIQVPLRNENIQPKQTSDILLNESVNADSMTSANNDKTTPINPVSLPQDYKPSDKADNSKLSDNAVNEVKEQQTTDITHEMLPQSTNLNYSPQLANLLNSIYKQANKQDENQKSKHEKLTKILNYSIQAKTNAEKERINRFNKCLDTIEKTFSAGTVDMIIKTY